MAARKTKLNNFQSRKALYKLSDCDNSLHETFRNASVTRPPQPAAPLTRRIECRPVGGHASGVPLYIYIYVCIQMAFEVDKIFLQNFFQKNQLSIPDSRAK